MAVSKYGYQVQDANIDVSSSGDHNLVSLITGKKIRLVSMFLQVSDVVIIQFKSGSTAKGGVMQLTDQDQIILPLNEYGWLRTATSEALVLNTSNANQVSGWLSWVEE